ncbi:hypothetical protein DXG01_000568 [Tephrocybe rancida]|nr:hypothetical protein DXG01_000568 [Tephrocybe rancida]
MKREIAARTEEVRSGSEFSDQRADTFTMLVRANEQETGKLKLKYNPRYFPDPEESKPSRWCGVSSESEVFSVFSLGPRAYIGRKFVTVEAVTFLTMLLREWRVDPAFKAGETTAAWRERVLSMPTMELALGVKGAPVRLTRRQA